MANKSKVFHSFAELADHARRETVQAVKTAGGRKPKKLPPPVAKPEPAAHRK